MHVSPPASIAKATRTAETVLARCNPGAQLGLTQTADDAASDTTELTQHAARRHSCRPLPLGVTVSVGKADDVGEVEDEGQQDDGQEGDVAGKGTQGGEGQS